MASQAASTRTLRTRNKVINYSGQTAAGGPAPPKSISKLALPVQKRRNAQKSPARTSSAAAELGLTQGSEISQGTWCSRCVNGGIVILCDACGRISACTDCLNYDFEKQGDQIFICPPCFKKQDNDNLPYPFKLASKTAVRENWPEINLDSMAIISIHLSGMIDTPGRVSYEILQPWLQGNLVFFDLEFNFAEDNGKFEDQIDTMIDSLEGNFKKCCRFLVTITTHSDPENGYVHIEPHGLGAAPIWQLFDRIFSERFKKVLQREKENTNVLAMLSCGALLRIDSSREFLQQFCATMTFNKILGFTQEHFQPFFSTRFLMDLSVQHFIHNRHALRAILPDHQALGAHTDIMEFTLNTATTFTWVHQGSHPNGEVYQRQCPECGRLKTAGPKLDKEGTVTFTCMFSGCKGKSTFKFPSGASWVYGKPPDQTDSRGGWLHIKKKGAAGEPDLGA